MENEKTQENTNNLATLYTALSKAQGEMEMALKQSTNPYFRSRYADFASVIKASREHLTKHGLCVIQRILTKGDKMVLNTMLAHSSGASIDSEMFINPPKSDIQSIGSYITYIKRYMYAAIVGIATTDDDGESAMKGARAIDGVQVTEVKGLISKLHGKDELEKLLKWCQIDKVEEITQDKYSAVTAALNAKIAKQNKEENDGL